MAGPSAGQHEGTGYLGKREESAFKRGGSQSEEGGTPKPSCLLYGFAEDSCFVTRLSPGRDN